jgi:hypothetical protein
METIYGSAFECKLVIARHVTQMIKNVDDGFDPGRAVSGRSRQTFSLCTLTMNRQAATCQIRLHSFAKAIVLCGAQTLHMHASDYGQNRLCAPHNR